MYQGLAAGGIAAGALAPVAALSGLGWVYLLMLAFVLTGCAFAVMRCIPRKES